jgi:hypothetical protein
MLKLEDRAANVAPVLPGLSPVALAAAVAGLFGSEIIHMAAIGQHIRFWAVEGWFFTLLAVVEGVLAAGLLLRATPRVRLITFAVSVTTVALWAMSRLNGLPFGPGAGEREIVALPDLIATLLEAVTAAAVFPGAAALSRYVRRPRLVIAAIVSLSASLTSLALIAISATSGVASTASHLH